MSTTQIPNIAVAMEPAFVDRTTARAMLGNLSNSKLDELVRAGRITPQMIDGKTVFAPSEIRRFATSCPSWEPRTATG